MSVEAPLSGRSPTGQSTADFVSERVSFEATVNGDEVQLQVPAVRRLVDILREDLDLTGTKISCGIGRCGACMVLMDGQPVNACLVMAYQGNGSEITTVEALSVDGSDPVQEAFLTEGGFQCGYCTPGMIMSVKGVLAEEDEPAYEDLKAAIAGNLCRCTGYTGIFRALKQLASGTGTGDSDCE